jgi:hypothetical protein
MDWFERLTGFRETNYDDTRAKLKVDGSRLQSLINGKSYGIGELELVPVQALRERVKSAGGLPGRLKARVVTGDVRQMHQSPENAGALFQVASQFNLLEMTSYDVTPEHGVTRYQHDRTQGPACAIAAGAATIYRNYFAPVGGRDGQTTERQFDGLADLGAALGDALNQPVKALWSMQNGYALCTRAGLDAIAKHLGDLQPEQLDSLRGKLSIGVHRDVEVTDAAGQHRPLVSLLLGPPGGLHSRAPLPLGSIRVAGAARGVRSHDVGCRVERTTRRIERRSAHATWRGRLRKSRRLDSRRHATIPRHDVWVRTRCEACELWDTVASDTANGRGI